MKFLFTCDVELTSIPENRETSEMADALLKTGLPRVLGLCSEFEIPATFYFTANLAEIRPECLDLVRGQGHEVGCHGMRHDSSSGYDVMPYDEQVRSLALARTTLEKLGAGPVRAFRAPEARINTATVRALATLGFTSDSSVCPQRFDGLLSNGFRQKLKWLVAPRRPYFLSDSSIIAAGSTGVLEIPISALLAPYIGTAMRISPGIIRMLQRFLFNEARRDSNHPVVFLFHPNECIEYPEAGKKKPFARAILTDRLRTSLKLRNLGLPAVGLVREVLRSAKNEGFEFTTANRFRATFKGGGL